MGSSTQLSHDLKMKLIEAFKGGQGYKKISKRFGFSISTIRNIIRKWKSTGSVEVRTRSGRPRKISDSTARLLGRKAAQNPHVTVKNLQEGLLDAGVVVHPSTVQRCLRKQGLQGRVRRRPQQTGQRSEAEACTAKSESGSGNECRRSS